ncbi:MAG: DPP IV N-terminal domain-containing protein, partial [Elusimicrobia bacterium]|nr:DPP IV N-terminal domain-containing protein [Elusimicrobiota bacterium]
MKKYIRGVIMSAVILSALQLPLQPFGKNKVITRDFRWEICHTEHFDVYFYEEGRNVLPFFVDLLERVYRRATALSGVEITEKIPVFLYIGHNEFEQTNITDIGEGTGGVTEAFKNRLVVPHLGSRAWLEYVMHHEFAHEVQYAVLFSGFWKSAKLLKFPIYPLWLMEGLAEYHTGALGLTEKEMYLRDATLSGNLIPLDKMQNFSHLKPHYVTLAYKESHALMDFIVEEYGEQKPYEILNSYKDKFDAASVLLETINITLQNLDVKFREHMEDKYRFASAGMKEPQEYGLRVTKPNIYWTFNTNPVFLPGDMGGKDSRIAFITDKRGVEEIVMQDARSGKTTTLVGKRDIDYVENISRLGRGISVSGDGRYLVFVGEKEQKDRIYIYDMKSRGIERIELDFSVINSADISHDGRRVVFIGMRGGHTDIYSSDLDGKNLRRHTSDFNSVSDAVLSKNGKFIVFAKERTVNDIERPHQRDLYKLDIETGSTTRLTDFSKDEFSPAISPDDATVIFVSDKDGVYDLYALDLAT